MEFLYYHGSPIRRIAEQNETLFVIRAITVNSRIVPNPKSSKLGLGRALNLELLPVWGGATRPSQVYATIPAYVGA